MTQETTKNINDMMEDNYDTMYEHLMSYYPSEEVDMFFEYCNKMMKNKK